MDDLPRFRIEIPSGRAIFGRVFMDDVELRGVTRVRFDTGEDVHGFVQVVVTMYADDVTVSGEAQVRLEPHDPEPFAHPRLGVFDIYGVERPPADLGQQYRGKKP